MKFIKVTTENQVSTIELPATDYKTIAESIGAEMIEIVRIRNKAMSADDMVMVADEEGLFKPENRCNPVGSVLYGTMEHGNPIVGDILLAKLDRSNHEGDFEDIPAEEAERIVTAMQGAIIALLASGIAGELRRRYDKSQPKPPVVLTYSNAEELMSRLKELHDAGGMS